MKQVNYESEFYFIWEVLSDLKSEIAKYGFDNTSIDIQFSDDNLSIGVSINYFIDNKEQTFKSSHCFSKIDLKNSGRIINIKEIAKGMSHGMRLEVSKREAKAYTDKKRGLLYA